MAVLPFGDDDDDDDSGSVGGGSGSGSGNDDDDDGGGGVPVVLLTAPSTLSASSLSSPDRELRFFSSSDRRPSGWKGSSNGS
jgi:hypothetical protein